MIIYTEAEAVVRRAFGDALAAFDQDEWVLGVAALAALDEMRKEYERVLERYRLAHADWSETARVAEEWKEHAHDTERRLAEAETALNGMVDLFGRQHAEESEVYAVKQAVAYLASRDQEDQG